MYYDWNPHALDPGTIYRCAVEGCHCEISITLPPKSTPATQPFVDCCGHPMVKVSAEEEYGRGFKGYE